MFKYKCAVLCQNNPSCCLHVTKCSRLTNNCYEQSNLQGSAKMLSPLTVENKYKFTKLGQEESNIWFVSLSLHGRNVCRTVFNVPPDSHIESLESSENHVVEGTSKWSCKIKVSGKSSPVQMNVECSYQMK